MSSGQDPQPDRRARSGHAQQVEDQVHRLRGWRLMPDRLTATPASAAMTARPSWIWRAVVRYGKPALKACGEDREARPLGDHKIPVVPVNLPVALQWLQIAVPFGRLQHDAPQLTPNLWNFGQPPEDLPGASRRPRTSGDHLPLSVGNNSLRAESLLGSPGHAECVRRRDDRTLNRAGRVTPVLSPQFTVHLSGNPNGGIRAR